VKIGLGAKKHKLWGHRLSEGTRGFSSLVENEVHENSCSNSLVAACRAGSWRLGVGFFMRVPVSRRVLRRSGQGGRMADLTQRRERPARPAATESGIARRLTSSRLTQIWEKKTLHLRPSASICGQRPFLLPSFTPFRGKRHLVWLRLGVVASLRRISHADCGLGLSRQMIDSGGRC